MAAHSSVLAWRILGVGEPSGLPSMGSHRVGHDRSDLAAAAAEPLRRKITCVILKFELLIRNLQIKILSSQVASPVNPIDTQGGNNNNSTATCPEH